MPAAVDVKKQDDKRIKQLREFQRSNAANKRCFDCCEMMPQYVCLDFNTFVCTSCSGIHREFAHRIKSLSMSRFTDAEVKNMLNYGGNEAAFKYWRSSFDVSFRAPGLTEGERTRNLIRQTYIDRRWVEKSPRESCQTTKSQPIATRKVENVSTSSAAAEILPSSEDPFGAFVDDTSAPTHDFAPFADFGNFAEFTAQQGGLSAPVASDTFGDLVAPTKTTTADFEAFGDFVSFEESTAKPLASKQSEFVPFTFAPPPSSSFSGETTFHFGGESQSNVSSSSKVPTLDLFQFDSISDSATKFSQPTDVVSQRIDSNPSSSGFENFSITSTSAATADEAFIIFNTSNDSQGQSFQNASLNAFPNKAIDTNCDMADFGDFIASGPTESNLSMTSRSASNALDVFDDVAPLSTRPERHLSKEKMLTNPSDPFAISSATDQLDKVAQDITKTESSDPFAAFNTLEAYHPGTPKSLQPASNPPPSANISGSKDCLGSFNEQMHANNGFGFGVLNHGTSSEAGSTNITAPFMFGDANHMTSQLHNAAVHYPQHAQIPMQGFAPMMPVAYQSLTSVNQNNSPILSTGNIVSSSPLATQQPIQNVMNMAYQQHPNWPTPILGKQLCAPSPLSAPSESTQTKRADSLKQLDPFASLGIDKLALAENQTPSRPDSFSKKTSQAHSQTFTAGGVCQQSNASEGITEVNTSANPSAIIPPLINTISPSSPFGSESFAGLNGSQTDSFTKTSSTLERPSKANDNPFDFF